MFGSIHSLSRHNLWIGDTWKLNKKRAEHFVFCHISAGHLQESGEFKNHETRDLWVFKIQDRFYWKQQTLARLQMVMYVNAKVAWPVMTSFVTNVQMKNITYSHFDYNQSLILYLVSRSSTSTSSTFTFGLCCSYFVDLLANSEATSASCLWRLAFPCYLSVYED